MGNGRMRVIPASLEVAPLNYQTLRYDRSRPRFWIAISGEAARRLRGLVMIEKGAQVIAFPPRGRGRDLWEPWVSDVVIARHCKVSTRTVRRWRVQGMPSRMLGGSRRFRLSEVERWHAERSAS
jgi:hypothetical protein